MNSSIEHIKLVNEIAELCMNHNLTIFEHEYNYMAFGSWLMVIGKRKRRMKFRWDGKESNLNISVSDFQYSSSVANWEPVAPRIGGAPETEAEVFDFMMATLKKQFSI